MDEKKIKSLLKGIHSERSSQRLTHPWQMRALMLGTAIGLGNFLVLPPLYVNHSPLIVLLLHILSLILLGAPLLIGEMLWSRWLQRPYQESFQIFGRAGFFLSFITLIALVDIAPTYVRDLSRLLFLGAESGFRESDFFEHFHLAQSPTVAGRLLLYAMSLALIALGLWFVARGVKKLASVMLSMMGIASVFLLGTLWVLFYTFETEGLSRFLAVDFRTVNVELIQDIATFSLFTLSAGYGVHYNFVLYAGQNPSTETLFRKPGSIYRLVLTVIAGDLAASVLALLFTLPASGLARNPEIWASNPWFILTQFWTQLLRPMPMGSWVLFFYDLGLFLFGYVAFLTILESLVQFVSVALKWSRMQSALLLMGLAVFLCALPLVTHFDWIISQFGVRLFLPLSALGFCYAVGWKMPRKTQDQLLGRSHSLEALNGIWRFSIRWLLPNILMISLVVSAIQLTRKIVEFFENTP